MLDLKSQDRLQIATPKHKLQPSDSYSSMQPQKAPTNSLLQPVEDYNCHQDDLHARAPKSWAASELEDHFTAVFSIKGYSKTCSVEEFQARRAVDDPWLYIDHQVCFADHQCLSFWKVVCLFTCMLPEMVPKCKPKK